MDSGQVMQRAVKALERLGLLEYPEGLPFSVVDYRGIRVGGMAFPEYWTEMILAGAQPNSAPAYPDPESPLVMGWLLDRARVAWKCPTLTTVSRREEDGSMSWGVEDFGLYSIPIIDHQPTEIGALSALIEMAAASAGEGE